MSEVNRETVARIRAAICAEINRQVGSDSWSVPFSLDAIAVAAAREALRPLDRVEDAA